eukprot:s7609_g2.t1
MVLSCLPGASLVPRRLSKYSFLASLVPPWCLASCPISPFLPAWCLPGASQAVQLVLSCLPGASLVPPRLSNWSFPASQAVQLVLSCLPGASQAVQLDLSCLPGASHGCPMVLLGVLAPPGLSNGLCTALIKSGRGRLLESIGLALADYWSHPVVGI